MSAKVPKADIKARGELDGRAHIAVQDVGTSNLLIGRSRFVPPECIVSSKLMNL